MSTQSGEIFADKLQMVYAEDLHLFKSLRVNFKIA
jgi:hypothetical protein